MLLAIDIGGLFAVGFLMISFVGWIINLVNAQNPPAAPNRGRNPGQQRRPQARDKKVQNEIEQFLQEAMTGKEQPEAVVRPDEIEVVEEPPPRPRKQRLRKQRRPPQSAPQKKKAHRLERQTVETQKRNKPGQGLSSRHLLPSDDLGDGVSSHVSEHMQKRMSQRVSMALPHSVNQGVSQHLGDFTADDFDTRSSVKPDRRSRANISDPAGLIADLRSSDGMRKAIILQEILSKPRAFRK